MSRKFMLCLSAWLALGVPATLPLTAQDVAGEGDEHLLAALQDWNGVLRAEWMDLRAQQLEALGKEKGKVTAQLFRQPFRWVSGDPRRGAVGTGLTYTVDTPDLAASGLDPAEAEAAVDRAMATWNSAKCFQKVGFAKRSAAGTDADIFDSAYGYGGLGDYKVADVVHAGFLPPAFFEQVAGPGGSEEVVALSVTFIYVDAEGEPTDADGDGFLDTAHNEVYYNPAFSWADGAMDLETVALHEVGHSLGLGHFGPPPAAVMNPVYAGPRRSLEKRDRSELCPIWASWPR